jgi:stearoyl-CoA desaturase (delta-9 desaturase)
MIKRAIANVVCVSLLLSPFSATAGTYRATGLSLRTSVFFFAALSAYSPALNMGAHIDASYRLEEMVPLPPLHPDFGRTNGTTFFPSSLMSAATARNFSNTLGTTRPYSGPDTYSPRPLNSLQTTTPNFNGVLDRTRHLMANPWPHSATGISENSGSHTVLAAAGLAAPALKRKITPRRLVTLASIALPTLSFIGTAAYFKAYGIDWLQLKIALGMYILTGLGVTIGYHRLFTHRSFKTVPIIQWLLAVSGSMAVEGPVAEWVAHHRIHHAHTDVAGDPHSPLLSGPGAIGALKGFWHAHMGWLFDENPKNLMRSAMDIMRDPVVGRVSKQFPTWVGVGLLIPAVVAGAIEQSWNAAAFGLLIGGGARIFVLHHVTWCVNSVCHLWGLRPYAVDNQATDNPVIAILGFGEGNHAGHHAFAQSAKHGLLPGQFDLSYCIIQLLKFMRLAWDVNVPTPEQIAAKLKKSTP